MNEFQYSVCTDEPRPQSGENMVYVFSSEEDALAFIAREDKNIQGVAMRRSGSYMAGGPAGIRVSHVWMHWQRGEDAVDGMS